MLKYFIALLPAFMQGRAAKQNLVVLLRFSLTMVLMVVVYSILFHVIMESEGREYTWLTGVYWTLTVMSTLGFGDITFLSDTGRAFSILVLLSGVIFFLIMLPFTFIQHFYVPWIERQKKETVPRRVPKETKGHVLIAGTTPIALNLAQVLERYDMQAIVLCSDMQTAMQLMGQGFEVVLGEHDDMETYRNLKAETASLLVVLDTDLRSANIVFSAREAAPNLPIVAAVEKLEARDILRMAGCSRCFHFYSLLGEALARRVIKPSHRVSILGRFGRIVVAEAPVMRTPLAGKNLISSAIRKESGVNVVGVWERGVFSLPRVDTVFSQSTVLMVAGTEEQIAAFNRLVSSNDSEPDLQQPPIIIIGGGRVGLAVARSLSRRGIPALIVDRKDSIHAGTTPIIKGDASDLSVLEKAGIRHTPSIIVTTHTDDANIYLTIYCRRLRPDVQIISRASLDRNVNGLHMAGADLVLSLASLVSSTVFNLLSPNRVIMLNERLAVFSYTIRGSLAGKTLRDSGIRNKTRCSVLAVHGPDGSVSVNPDAGYEFKKGDMMYLIGDNQAQEAFKTHFGAPESKDTSPSSPKWRAATPAESSLELQSKEDGRSADELSDKEANKSEEAQAEAEKTDAVVTAKEEATSEKESQNPGQPQS